MFLDYLALGITLMGLTLVFYTFIYIHDPAPYRYEVDRLMLFRKVLPASASIPSMFPPVFMDVTIEGEMYQEMHADGGVFFQSFFVGSLVDLPGTIRAAHSDHAGPVEQHLYVIRNGWVSPSPPPVQRALPSISIRAILSLLRVSSINDLWRLSLSTRDDDVRFHYIAIPPDYVPSTIEQFNREEMNREFDCGHEMRSKASRGETRRRAMPPRQSRSRSSGQPWPANLASQA